MTTRKTVFKAVPDSAADAFQSRHVGHVRLESGGLVAVNTAPDGRLDLSIIAPEGTSAAAYITREEIAVLARELGAIR